MDEKWFLQLCELSPQVQRKFKVGNYQNARADFLSSKAVEPSFELPYLKTGDDNLKLEKLIHLSESIEKCPDTNPVVKKLYQEKIVEKQRQFKLINFYKQKPSKIDNDELTSMVESVYGRPSQSVFNHLISVLRDSLNHVTNELKNSPEFERLNEVLTTDSESEVKDFVPIESKDFGEIVYTDAREVRHYILKRLPVLGLADWRVQISCDSVGGFKVWPRTKRIIVPTSKMLVARKGDRVLTATRLEAMIAHEVMTHAVRAENGFNSGLKLLAVGLASYWRGEEGVAGYREQQIVGATDYMNKNMHFTIGLAYGLDRQGVKRSFREVFDILIDYFLVIGGLDNNSAINKAFTACERIFYGATGSGTAFVMTKDIAYREGNIAVYRLLEKNPAAEEWFDVGKFDPTNQGHVSALQTLGLINVSHGK